jgi:hypothetical protein
MKKIESLEMLPSEQLLVSLTTPHWFAVYLLPCGFVIFPIYRVLFGANGPGWASFGVFLGVLILIRFGTAFFRRLLPVSEKIKAGWSRNRALAKRYDSYQWQKLFWVGCGIFAYAALFDGFGSLPLGFAAACVLAGGFAAWVWQKAKTRNVNL